MGKGKKGFKGRLDFSLSIGLWSYVVLLIVKKVISETNSNSMSHILQNHKISKRKKKHFKTIFRNKIK